MATLASYFVGEPSYRKSEEDYEDSEDEETEVFVRYDESAVQDQNKPAWAPCFFYFLNKEVYSYVGQEIIIEEGLDSYAGMIWPAGLALCHFLDTHRKQVDLMDMAVLEIGAGTGLVSIVATLLGAWVTSTDLPEVLNNLRVNLNRNTRGRCRYTPQVAALSWGYDLECTYPKSVYHYDYVLAADVVYHHDYLDELLATMKHFCRPGTTLIWANKVRFGSDVTFTENFKKSFDTKLLAEEGDMKIFTATYKEIEEEEEEEEEEDGVGVEEKEDIQEVKVEEEDEDEDEDEEEDDVGVEEKEHVQEVKAGEEEEDEDGVEKTTDLQEKKAEEEEEDDVGVEKTTDLQEERAEEEEEDDVGVEKMTDLQEEKAEEEEEDDVGVEKMTNIQEEKAEEEEEDDVGVEKTTNLQEEKAEEEEEDDVGVEKMTDLQEEKAEEEEEDDVGVEEKENLPEVKAEEEEEEGAVQYCVKERYEVPENGNSELEEHYTSLSERRDDREEKNKEEEIKLKDEGYEEDEKDDTESGDTSLSSASDDNFTEPTNIKQPVVQLVTKPSWVPNVTRRLDRDFYHYVGQDIVIHESIDSYGAVMWPAALALCSFLENNRELVNLQGKEVLELGAGTGLVSIVASLLGASVTATDLPEILGNLQANISRNTRGRCRYTPQVAALSWGFNLERTHPKSRYQYDYMLAADVVYHHDYLDELLATMKHFCRPGTTLIWANKVRFGSDVTFTENFKKSFHTTVLAEDGDMKIFMATFRK